MRHFNRSFSASRGVLATTAILTSGVLSIASLMLLPNLQEQSASQVCSKARIWVYMRQTLYLVLSHTYCMRCNKLVKAPLKDYLGKS